MTSPSFRSKRKRKLIVLEKGQNFDVSSISHSDVASGLVEVIVIPAAPAEDLFGNASPPDTLWPSIVATGQDPKCARCCPYDCDVAVTVMVQDAHSAASFEGFDLRRIPPSDGDLVNLAMSAFDIDPDAPDARQRLHRELRHKRRRGRNGRPPDFFRIAVAMELEGVTPSDTAEMIAERIERYFPNLTDASQVQKAERWLREYRERSEATTP